MEDRSRGGGVNSAWRSLSGDDVFGALACREFWELIEGLTGCREMA